MEKNRSETTGKILNLPLEIIYLLIGEDYKLVRTFDNYVTPNGQPDREKQYTESEDLIMKLPTYYLIPSKKILDVTLKIIELLTGEVPLRYPDVTVYFSMEEWEYLERHKDLYKDIIMEDHQTLTSPG
ncbi:gastrula zinc finger protein XlCGF66.1-like isoform X2 [Pyxicephalus adspersus]|uniref:gastrula zinc finger protein XlCGF66.1-like isoform X2 n=1 Tax=Pyxicephalus adspersus TaxID=30357 RepID=UPI003B5BEE0A